MFLALLDAGANSCFMDRDFTQLHKISLVKLSCPISIVVIDGNPIASGKIIEESEPIRLVLGSFSCVISFNIFSSPEHPIILGLLWFELHNPRINWKHEKSYGDSRLKLNMKPLLMNIKIVNVVFQLFLYNNY